MSKWHRIVSPGNDQQYWQGDRAPDQKEIDEIVAEWQGGLEPMEVPQIVTDYLLVQRHMLWGWQTMHTIYLLDSLDATQTPDE